MVAFNLDILEWVIPTPGIRARLVHLALRSTTRPLDQRLAIELSSLNALYTAVRDQL